MPILALFIILYVLNLFDAGVTYYLVSVVKVTKELNPIMEFLLNIHPMAFLSFKTLGVALALGLIYWRLFCREKDTRFYRRMQSSWVVGTTAFIVLYSILAGIHICNIAEYFKMTG